MRDVSRRAILKFAAAGSAATLPAVALAAPDRIPADPVQLSDREQLDACMANMEAILARMHPVVSRQSIRYDPQMDGTYRVWCHSAREFLPWSGPGLYRVSQDGYLIDFWVIKVERRTLSGRVYREDFEGIMWLEWEGRYHDEPRFLGRDPCIVAKLEGAAPC